MKILLNGVLKSALILLLGFVAACSSDPETEPAKGQSLEISVESTSAVSANIVIKSEGIAEVVWLVSDVAVDQNVVYNTGNKIKITSSVQSATINGFEPNSQNTIYFAATTTENKFYGKVLSVEVATGDFTEEYTLFDVDYRSAKINIKFPEEVRERGNVLKWGFCDIGIYRKGGSDASKINMHDGFYKNYFSEDKLFILNDDDENMYNIREDGSFDDGYPYYEPLYPNMDAFFILGEFSYVDEENIGYWTTDEDGVEVYVDFTDGYHEPGYYKALFDYESWNADHSNNTELASAAWRTTPLASNAIADQSKYWTGYYRLINFKTKAPELLNGKVDLDFSGLTPSGGEIIMTPDDNVLFYLAAIFTPDHWAALSQVVQNPDDPAEIQAFLTSSSAAYSYGISMYGGEDILYPGQILMSPDPETEYHVVIIGSGDEDMTKQFMQIEKFNLPKSTLTKPDMEVELLSDMTTTTDLYFRVKCPQGDAAAAKYAMNSARNWDLLTSKQSYSVENVVNSKGAYFTGNELMEIISEEGHIIRFSNLTPGQKYGFGALCYNKDNFYGNAGYVEATTLQLDTPARLDSPYFDSLDGEWTLTATISYKEYDNKTFEWYPVTSERKSRVVIGDIVMPALTEDDYVTAENNYYGTVSREELDKIYGDVVDALPTYHENIRANNRILCQGYDLYPWLTTRHFSSTDYHSPYDLLTDRYYPYYDEQTLFFEYGPKWYFEVLSDGTLGVPFNANIMDPAYGYEGPYYLAGINSHAEGATEGNYSALLAGVENGNWTTGYFPVTFRDENTIVIEPYNYQGEDFYAHCVMVDANGYSLQALIISDIVLTRGWDESNHPEYGNGEVSSTLNTKATGIAPIRVSGNNNFKPAIKPRAITKFGVE